MNLSTNDRGSKTNRIKIKGYGAETIGLPQAKKKRQFQFISYNI